MLGGLLLDNTAWDKIADLIGESDFYRADHRLIYRHISKLIEHSRPADVITVAESLESTKELDSRRRHRLSGRAGAEHAHRRQHPALCGNRARTRGHAQARRGRHRNRRCGLQPDGQGSRTTARRGRVESVRDLGGGRARQAGIHGDAAAAHPGRRAHRHALQPRQSFGRHRRADRLHRSRPHDFRAAAGRPGDRCRQARRWARPRSP